ncbi:hypothetical protein QIA19_00150 (plasmid) [Borreliella finlandensis]|uniref:hypothetical protein n=1 Tax=Borreliella finlandensis TaxID=498741 RepID=UPI00264A2A28|nr:hypothetical protein [Borreliella finlandensis]WKC89473.1 hypothetical protein QIA19_00150 [Borreliella finlandensis]
MKHKIIVSLFIFLFLACNPDFDTRQKDMNYQSSKKVPKSNKKRLKSSKKELEPKTKANPNQEENSNQKENYYTNPQKHIA